MARTIVSISDQNLLDAMGNWWQIEHAGEDYPHGNFTINQIQDALAYYTDRWTWDTGSPEDRLPMDTLYAELGRLRHNRRNHSALVSKVRSKVTGRPDARKRLAERLQTRITGTATAWYLA